MAILVLGIDLGKNSCSLVGLDETGAVVLRRRMRREAVPGFVEAMPSCIVAMEACCGAHHLGRLFSAYGHEVRLMSPEYVRPYVKAQKNDDRDAEAIAEAATRPTMRFVPVKSEAQSDVQALHCARARLIAERTALINHLRGPSRMPTHLPPPPPEPWHSSARCRGSRTAGGNPAPVWRQPRARRQGCDPPVELTPFLSQILDQPTHARRQTARLISQDLRQRLLKDPAGLRHDDPTLQQDRPQLIDQRRAPPNQPLPHPMDRLQVKLGLRFTGTNRIVGRCTASALASASR